MEARVSWQADRLASCRCARMAGPAYGLGRRCTSDCASQTPPVPRADEPAVQIPIVLSAPLQAPSPEVISPRALSSAPSRRRNFGSAIAPRSSEHSVMMGSPNFAHIVSNESQGLPIPAYFRIRDVLRITGLSRPTLYRRIAANRFPRPVHLGGRACGWSRVAITAWIADPAGYCTSKPDSESQPRKRGRPRKYEAEQPSHEGPFS